MLYPYRHWWIAHCLELDLVAEGNTPREAFENLVEISTLQVETARHNENLESIFRPAPPEIWAMFSRAGDGPLMKKKPTKSVERFVARQLAFA